MTRITMLIDQLSRSITSTAHMHQRALAAIECATDRHYDVALRHIQSAGDSAGNARAYIDMMDTILREMKLAAAKSK